MPEGHTIHRLARDHRKYFAGQSLAVLSPQGRFADEAKLLSGKKLLDVEAYGKHLFYVWTRRRRVHVHLGLYGKFRLHKNPAPDPQGAVRVRMVGQSKAFDLNGPNRCELLDNDSYLKIIERLGEDPLRSDAEPGIARERICKSKAAIGSLLLNQSIIAGIGNVYRAEVLYLLGIHPERPGTDIDHETFDQLWSLSVKLMKLGVKYNRIVTVDRNTAGKPLGQLTKPERLWCYKKPNCPRCRRKIRTWSLGSRTMYACEKCQT